MTRLRKNLSNAFSILLACSLTAHGYEADEPDKDVSRAGGAKMEESSQAEKMVGEKEAKSEGDTPPGETRGEKKRGENPKPEKKEKPARKKQPEIIGHPFSWPFVGWEKMKPMGGTTKGSRTELNAEANPDFYRIQERGIEKKERDRRAILALAGDYRVSFDFIETASSAHPYEPPRPYFSWATERAFVIEERPDFISIQHIMVMEFVDENGEVNGPFTMKHWRQDWTYQDTEIFRYTGGQTWSSRSVEGKAGRWSQAVYQVDDSPRYETTGTWDHRGGISVFRSQPFWRPLPRREFSVRDDYNVLGGRHEITVTPSGWLHTQINRKIIAKDGRIEKMLAQELGAVRYERISSPSLDAAADYWEATAPLWAAVREKWDTVLSGQAAVRLKKSVDEKPMYTHLFGLVGKLEEGGIDDSERDEAINQAIEVIDRFIEVSDE